jgi:diguanylate cyclase (GGDEF)-like protein
MSKLSEHQPTKTSGPASTATLRDRETLLTQQNAMFDVAINNMSQGLLMFDEEQRLLIRNKRYCEIYGLSPTQVKHGMLAAELLLLRRSAGSFSGDPVEHLAQVRKVIDSGEAFSRLVELPDGRTISVVSRTSKGGAWVVTHEDITERRQAEKQIAHLAHHDPLTGLPNRLLFRERLQHALAQAKRGNRFAVHYLDLDNFKNVNDTLGHMLGDELLKLVASRLRHCIREADTVARVAGDEFAIIQTRIENPADVAAMAAHVCETIAEPYDIQDRCVSSNTSIGLAIAPGDGTTPDELLKNADLALYRAKADGRGTFRFFEPEMDARVKARRAMESALRRALAEGEFVLHYQPIVNADDNRVTCCEALVRWQHPERGLIQPGEFIGLAEDIGLIGALGEWVLRKACADAANWPNDVKVAVNLSPLQIMNPTLLPTIVNALASARLAATRLEIEITESVMMQNTEAVLATLHRLRELGVKISLDDFGTGYSSLSYLRRFPFDKLKIDRSFIGDLSRGGNAQPIVLAVNTMAKSLGMITTAEGVETLQQFDHARALGCTEVQGFFISRPKPVEDINELIHRLGPRKLRTA